MINPRYIVDIIFTIALRLLLIVIKLLIVLKFRITLILLI